MKPHERTSIKQKLIFPSVFAIIFITIIFFKVLPLAQEISRARFIIEELRADLNEQNQLRPIHLTLEQGMKKSLPDGIAVNAIEPLKISDLAELPDAFEVLARESEVELVSATPQVRSLQGGREMLLVDINISGDFMSYSLILNQLNKIKFIETIESWAINVTSLGHEMTLSVWLAIQ